MQALRLVNTKDISRDDWLAWRRKGIGGSDVAAICGLSRYKSAVEVYLDKLELSPPKEDNPSMKAGRMLEPTIAEWFSEETGYRVMQQNSIFQHPEHKIMLANIDRWVIGHNAGLEVKNTKEYCRNDWFDGQTEIIPTEYQLQANHYMAILGAERWFICVLIGGWDLQWRVIERDEKLIRNLITIEEDFWNNFVLAKQIPPFSAQDTDTLNQMYPRSKPNLKVDISESYYDLVKNLLNAKEQKEKSEIAYEDVKNKFKGIMGESELAFWQGDPLISWKSDKNGKRSFKVVGGL